MLNWYLLVFVGSPSYGGQKVNRGIIVELTCWKRLNREGIKIMAMAAMFCNHLAIALLPWDTVLYEILVDIGYFTAVTMCYFLVEGYEYTHSKRKYGLRLLIFGFVSQIPYFLAIGYYQLNMMFTLFFCFMILVVMDKIKNKALQILCVAGLVLCTLFSDWPLFAAVYTIMFALSKGNRRKTAVSYGIAAILYGGFNSFLNLQYYAWPEALFHGVISCAGIFISGFCILFFYFFYPAHLLFLGILRICIYGF